MSKILTRQIHDNGLGEFMIISLSNRNLKRAYDGLLLVFLEGVYVVGVGVFGFGLGRPLEYG